jgi:predicted NBD/HSP70 family sugar kinase
MKARKRILVIDVGGSTVKCHVPHQDEPVKFISGPKLTPRQMMRGVTRATRGQRFDVVTIGYPGAVRQGRIIREPHNLGRGWVRFDFRAAFGRPVRIINDAAMQALGAYRGGTMLFLGLGTGLGSALIVDGLVVPMELGHMHCKGKHTYEHFLGNAGRRRLGHKKWRAKLFAAVHGFIDALLPEEVVIGGGNVKKLVRLPPLTRRGSNADAFTGGIRLWNPRTLGKV